jgi:hypothetical protein
MEVRKKMREKKRNKMGRKITVEKKGKFWKL